MDGAGQQNKDSPTSIQWTVVGNPHPSAPDASRPVFADNDTTVSMPVADEVKAGGELFVSCSTLEAGGTATLRVTSTRRRHRCDEELKSTPPPTTIGLALASKRDFTSQRDWWSFYVYLGSARLSNTYQAESGLALQPAFSDSFHEDDTANVNSALVRLGSKCCTYTFTRLGNGNCSVRNNSCPGAAALEFEGPAPEEAASLVLSLFPGDTVSVLEPRPAGGSSSAGSSAPSSPGLTPAKPASLKLSAATAESAGSSQYFSESPSMAGAGQSTGISSSDDHQPPDFDPTGQFLM